MEGAIATQEDLLDAKASVASSTIDVDFDREAGIVFLSCGDIQCIQYSVVSKDPCAQIRYGNISWPGGQARFQEISPTPVFDLAIFPAWCAAQDCSLRCLARAELLAGASPLCVRAPGSPLALLADSKSSTRPLVRRSSHSVFANHS